MNRQPELSASGSSVSNNTITSRVSLKRIRSVMQMSVFMMLIVMFLMNIFRGTPNDPQTTQTIYKMLDMPEMAAMTANGYSNVPTNRTAD